MAQATVEERHLLKAMRWYDGFVIALANPGFLIAALGYSVGSLGGWGAVALWSASMVIGVFQNFIYAEPAAMFPDKPGGIALYAHEGWRKYFSLVGPVATFGYWFAWSSVLAIFGETAGFLIQAEWATGQTWSYELLGFIHFDFPRMIAVILIAGVWIFNIFGMRLGVWVAYVTGGLLMIPLAVFMIVPYITGDWSSSNMEWLLGGEGQEWGGWKLAIVWLYLMGWSSYGVESAAAFAPEYHDTARDTALALRTSAMFSLAVYALLPLGSIGVLGTEAVAENPVAFYATAFDAIVGGASNLMVVFLIAALILSMNTATMDGSRALYGIARDGMTVKELFHLNRFHVPGRAMTVDMVVNIILVLLLTSTLSILAAGNLGYILAHFFALTGFLLLRKDRPDWPRPIRLASIFVPIAAILALLNGLFIAIGSWSFDLTGYGGLKELGIGLGVLAFSILLFVFRRIVQDKAHVHLREQIPLTPAEETRYATATTSTVAP